jgi:hypothetical protein
MLVYKAYKWGEKEGILAIYYKCIKRGFLGFYTRI